MWYKVERKSTFANDCNKMCARIKSIFSNHPPSSHLIRFQWIGIILLVLKSSVVMRQCLLFIECAISFRKATYFRHQIKAILYVQSFNSNGNINKNYNHESFAHVFKRLILMPLASIYPSAMDARPRRRHCTLNIDVTCCFAGGAYESGAGCFKISRTQSIVMIHST